ncbi:MAG: hypothetical protein ACREJ2_06990 [Planctomycetota bacterium]
MPAPGFAVEKLPRFHDRAMAAFIVDDVHGQDAASAAAFRAFRDWCGENGLRGETSLILGYRRDAEGSPLPLHPDYVRDLRQADQKKLFDAYMEVMTHGNRFDFGNGRIGLTGPHEGIWLLDESVAIEEYAAYFKNIAGMAAQYDLKVNGLTIPGCGCAACVAFKKGRRIAPLHAGCLNSGVALALLQMAQKGALATPLAGTFMGTVKAGPADVAVLAENGAHAVYDLPPGVSGDSFGRWDNDSKYVDPDVYVTADGTGGRLAELIAQGTRTLIYYGHWQGLRPDQGVGFAAFREVARRLATFYADRIEWMRPTAIAAYVHAWRHTELRPGPNLLGAFADTSPDGQLFELRIPFAAAHPISLRVRGSAQVKIRTPAKKFLTPWKVFPAEQCAIFDLTPETGRYEVLPG